LEKKLLENDGKFFFHDEKRAMREKKKVQFLSIVDQEDVQSYQFEKNLLENDGKTFFTKKKEQ
jgi:hypothetical protein